MPTVINAKKLHRIGGGRYTIKVITYAEPLSALQPEDVCGLMERMHEPGWRMCGISASGRPGELWLYYERTTQ
jgi:hypothetical protein